MSYAASHFSARGDYGRSRYRGDPGLFSGLKRLAGKAIGLASRLVPIPGASLIGGAVERLTAGRAPAAVMPGGTAVQLAPGAPGMALQRRPGGIGVGVSALGTVGAIRIGGRRMNMGNAKAARRAIRRIKGVRNLLKSIERQLPRRAAAGKPCRVGRRR